MTTQLLGYCGLSCTECPAYIAKRTDDQDLRIKIAKEWSSEDLPVSPEDVNCDGCTTTSGTRWTWCQQCLVRICAAERVVASCATCPDYGCDTLEAFFEMAGDEARQRLEDIRLNP
ncbi:DUF3795 domain-containing protein [Candidatus Bipolaricaulota bacterium]